MGSSIVPRKKTGTKKASVINHIPEDRFLFSVLGTENDSFYEAIMEHFFEIRYFYRKDGNFIDFDFEDNTNWNSFKGANVVYIAQDYLNHLCFTDRLEAEFAFLLEKGYQILVPVDIFYVGAYGVHGFHLSHTLHISGLARDGQGYYCQDFFRSFYKTELIPRSNILEAVGNYWKLGYRNTRGQENCTGLAALKRKEKFVFQFRPRIFLNRFENMLNMDYDFETPSYGLGIFDAVIRTQTNEIPFFRPSAVRKLYEFTDDILEIMKYRLVFLKGCDGMFAADRLLEKCGELQKLCEQNRRHMVRYELSRGRQLIMDKDETVKDMTVPLARLKEEVAALIRQILDQARKVF